MKVFLSYAKEDKDFILECYEELKRKNFEPWMDEHDLLPGQAWDNCLKANMKDTDVVLIFMSSRSVSKIGYVQKEWNYFIDKRREFPENFIYLIPIQLDQCSVPSLISSEIQFINIDRNLNSKAWNKVLRSIELASEQRNIIRINEDTSIDVRVEAKEISEKLNSLTGYEFNGTYPVVIDALNRFTEVNKLNESLVLNELVSTRSRLFDQPIDMERENNEPTFRDMYDISITGNVGFLKDNFISIIYTHYIYSGGAHGNHFFFSKNYFIESGKAISINPLSIFIDEFKSEAINFIENYCYEDISQQIIFRAETDELDMNWIKEGCTAIENRLDTILLKDSCLEIYFPPYTVAAYAFGDFIVQVSYYKMSKWLDKKEGSLYSKFRNEF